MKRFTMMLILVAVVSSPGYAQTLRIYHIDVEQAAATLFVAPGGKTLLVDSGKNGMGSRIKAVMDQAGATKVDYFVLTHYHEDHMGGVDDLVSLGVSVLEAYDRGNKAGLGGTTFNDYQGAVGDDAISSTPGMEIPLDPSMTVRCISSGGVVISEANASAGVDENDKSVSLLITYGPFRYFIGGDIEKPTEAKIAARDLVQNVHVYEADHHGSKTSSSLEFMKDLSPQVVIISNGNNAGYKHPSQSTLNLYAALSNPPQVFQTNKYLKGGDGGNVADAFIADLESVDQDGTILLTVDLAASKYVVSYGAHTHEFSTGGASPVAASVVIESLVPNPPGSDSQAEEVVLRNKEQGPVSITGWCLQDRSGLRWQLSGSVTLSAGEARTIRRNGRPMTLNNSGDEIRLMDAAGLMRDQFAYPGSAEGVRIQTGH